METGKHSVVYKAFKINRWDELDDIAPGPKIKKKLSILIRISF